MKELKEIKDYIKETYDLEFTEVNNELQYKKGRLIYFIGLQKEKKKLFIYFGKKGQGSFLTDYESITIDAILNNLGLI